MWHYQHAASSPRGAAPLDDPTGTVELAESRTSEVAAAAPDLRIDVSAQLISLEPGLFMLSVVAPNVIRTEGGMVLPCARFDPLPAYGAERTFLSSLTETALLTPSAPPAYLRVSGQRSSVLLTTYKASGPMPPPEIHITVVEQKAPAAAAAAPESGDALPSEPLTLLVHVQNHGDLQCGGGAWGAPPDGQGAVEGFAVTLGPDLPRGSIEYQAVLGQDWSSPWMEEGEFCGSRQMALPLMGARIRLRGQAAADFVCRVWGRFNGVEHGPFEDGTACQAEGALLGGLRVVVLPRRDSTDPAPAPAAPASAPTAPVAPKPRVRRARA